MELNKTERGFNIVEFLDAGGFKCSLQDSSLASEDCLWFGVSRIAAYDPSRVVRMHLTKEMTRNVACAMRDALDNKEINPATFQDRYDSTCTIIPGEATGGTVISIGVLEGFENWVGQPMLLSPELIKKLMPYLLGFLAEGTIAGEGGASQLEDPKAKVLDMVIPSSMLDRTNLGETGVSAYDLIQSFDLLMRLVSEDLISVAGSDTARKLHDQHSKIISTIND